MPKVITFSGKAENGKTTFANMLKAELEERGKTAIVFHFADFLKFICKQYYGWDGNKNEAGRKLLQTTGTEIFRKNNPGCWVRMAREFILGLGDSVDYVLIGDCRFHDEVEIADVSVRIDRVNYENHLTPEQRKHQSEVDLDDYNFDIVVLNDKGLKELQDKAHAFASML